MQASLRHIKIITLLFFLSLKLTVFSQFHSEYFNTRLNTAEFNKKLSLNLNASGFFHNNEYFATDIEGYTLTGVFIQPLLIYSLSENLWVGAGVHLLKYNGQEDFKEKTPMLNLFYKPNDNLQIILGSYNGGDNHALPEALYARELNFTGLVNNGVDINYKTNKISLETWLDWEKFIEHGDPDQEKFTFGTSAHFKLIDNGHSELSLPVHVLVNHTGGQIQNTSLPVKTISDFSSGLLYSKILNESFIKKIQLEGLMMLENDITDEISGNAFNFETRLMSKHFQGSLGYFSARNWESIHGNPLLFCGDDNSVNEKQLISFKAGFGQNIIGKNTISLRFEGYYDINTHRLQYMYGLYLVVNELIGIL